MTAYQVLARKWRPKTFADLVGQQHVVKALQNALDKGRLHHAYLLTGTRGVGKTTIARILAKSLNCENTLHGDPCGQCQTCCDIDAGRFVDLLEIDAASNTGIDNIREVLENAQYAPTVGKYKVYIIDEVHMLSKSAFNAMLKTLEEPPEHVKFILATTDPHKVPITVLSRCLQFVLRNMTPQQVTDHLTHVLKTEQIMYEPNALALLGRAANGSMRDALSLLDQAIAMGSGGVKELDVRQMIGAVDKRYLYDLLTFLMEQDGERLLVKAQEMAANAIGFDSALNDLAMWLQRLALIKTVPSAVATDDSERERLVHLANYFSDEQIQLYYQCVIHGKQDLPLAPDEYAGFVMTLLRMLAFAPFAAKNTPSDSVIEGTQLHNPPEKKSRELAETKQPAPETEVAPDTKITPETESSLHVKVEPAYDDTPMPAETWDDEPQNEVAPDEEIAPIQADVPELTAENWTRIADGLSELPSIAAAQMSLSHMAWVDYANGVLTLAVLRDKTQHTLTPEYLTRIEQALSQWYGTAIRVQVMDYHAGEHGETPNMAHARIAQEQRDWARHQMEADPAVQKIQQLLNARWVESTLEVLTDSESTK
ncbi:DNA polymerase III subunit gamma/tau [Kingella kingae]|nr:DNA polymerase III subunit gamma/tau [Kingella kingae]MDK4533752.1 DNA polymerase III subunit gamma/tau [Kingella kingae]MDK4540222.1 DNA polymerase III subunit gamma/tau [Kingella kingae]MDK4544072.1 DNA polymerase III subunit gamma/tau [Kingella kingae]MDK4552805.1 DNA polymerase III subunit gamma/tau [Kingella kingae]MDK4583950.1 DNA polymerase III subunit gamma/tau [Kingella kingae]